MYGVPGSKDKDDDDDSDDDDDDDNNNNNKVQTDRTIPTTNQTL